MIDCPKMTLLDFKNVVQFSDKLYLEYEYRAKAFVDQHRKKPSELNKNKAAFPHLLSHRYSALDYAIGGERESLVQYILDVAGLDINDDNNSLNQTPLMQSINKSNENIVNMLLARPDIDILKRNKAGYSALMFAAFKGLENTVSCLLTLSSTADILVKNDKGDCALSLAAERGHKKIVNACLERIDDINYLKKAKAQALSKYQQTLESSYCLPKERIDEVVVLINMRIQALKSNQLNQNHVNLSLFGKASHPVCETMIIHHEDGFEERFTYSF